MHYRVLLGLIGLAFLLVQPGHAQNEGATWYFGQRAGLDFKQQYPRPLTDGQTTSPAGVAAISDAGGKLLFYTDGKTVFNQSHSVMSNGSDLFGNNTASQSSIILPWPGHTGKFFLFTVGKVGTVTNPGKGLYYSMVDINLNQVDAGMRNILLEESCSEKVTAIRHANGRDWWILAHAINTSEFYVYLLADALTRQDDQVIGLKHMVDSNNPNDRGASGYMKASPDGTFLAVAIEGFRFFEVFRFNNTTGTLLLDPLPIPLAADSAYGVEFSPNSKYLYGTSRTSGILYRWNLETFTEEAVGQSQEILFSNASYQLGALQLAPNGKIYAAVNGRHFLGVINAPDFPKCNFSIRGASLYDYQLDKKGLSGYGLPNFPAAWQKKEIGFANTCQNDSTTIYLLNPEVFDTFREWKIAGMSHAATPGVYEYRQVFTAPGIYQVQAKGLKGGSELILTDTIRIHPRPVLDIADTTYLCSGQSVVLHNGQYAFYGISDGADVYRDSLRTISEAGFYKVTVFNYQGCSRTVATRAISSASPLIDTIEVSPALCTGANNGTIRILMKGDLPDYQFSWENYPVDTNYRTGLSAGSYPVTISMNGGCPIDTIITVVASTLDVKIYRTPANDSPVCPGSAVSLNATGADSYEWTHAPGIFQNSVTVYPDKDTVYYVTGSTGGQCFGTDSIRIAVFENHQLDLGPDRTSCAGVPVVLRGREYDPGSFYTEWNWSLGPKTDSVVITNSISNLSLWVKDRNGCYYDDDINVTFTNAARVRLTSSVPPDTPVCQGTEITITATGADSYLWSHDPGFDGRIIVFTPDRDTIFRVTGPREGGCPGSDSIRIRVYEKSVLELGPDRTACQGDTIVIRRPEYDPGSIFTDWNWSNGTTTDSLFTTISLPGLQLSVKDLNGCSYSDIVSIHFNPKPSITDVIKQDITCHGSGNGSLDIRIAGDPAGMQYSITDGETWAIGSLFRNLAAGDYSIRVRNEGTSCLSLSSSITILEPEPLDLTVTSIAPSCAECTDGEIRVAVTGGTGPYSFVWIGLPDQDSVLRTIGAGTYSVTVTDKNGCSAGTDYLLTASELFIPNAFSPNGGGRNDKWMIRILENRPDCLVQVYDRSGKLVYHTDSYYEPWDGTYLNQGKELPAGTYFYLVRVDRNDENKPPQRGTVTILR